MKIKDVKRNKVILYLNLYKQFSKSTIREMNKLINNIVNEKCMCVNFVTRIKIEI